MNITISLRHVFGSNSLYARMIWEALFRDVRGENFESLDSFLCDLEGIENYLNAGKRTLYWCYHFRGWTDLTDYNPGCEAYKIEVKSTEIVITKV